MNLTKSEDCFTAKFAPGVAGCHVLGADLQGGEHRAGTFPLIVGGQHLFLVKYTDEAPGTYGGERNDSPEFSHLRKGDTYERTMHVSTLTVHVQGND